MSATLVQELADQAQEVWAPIALDELKEQAILPTLVSKQYQGAISAFGDTVHVSMVNSAAGSIKTVGVDHEVYTSEKLVTQRISVTANKIIEATFELDSLIDLQTQLGSPEGQSKIRQALVKGMELQLNSFLYSKVAPSTSAPDHKLDGITDYNASQILIARKLASQSKWLPDNWWLLLDPSYYNDFLGAQTLTSADYVGGDLAIVGGKKPHNRFGFNIMEDNSAAMSQISPTGATEDLALAFHPDFLAFVMQQGMTFKLSDLHAQKRRGYLLSVEMLVGCELGLEGNIKHITGYNV